MDIYAAIELDTVLWWIVVIGYCLLIIGCVSMIYAVVTHIRETDRMYYDMRQSKLDHIRNAQHTLVHDSKQREG